MAISRDNPQAGPIPNCPHCKQAMPNISWNTRDTAIYQGGPPLAFMVFFCPSCRTTLNCQLMPLAQAVEPNKTGTRP